ncbi:MAG: CaiB/BaiF CoA-transferase family protein [Sphingomonadales bacterium]
MTTRDNTGRAGPLSGYRIIEFAGLGPAPFCAMLLSDMGADVIRIDRAGGNALAFPGDPRKDVMNRGRRSIQINLKDPRGVALALDLMRGADVVLEGFRPGIMEKLGVGPDACHAANPKLVYCRLTGWGQTGPLADRAGHDINYIAVAGALGAVQDKTGRPVFPLNYLGDFGAGSMFAAFGIVCALLETQKSGRGQVIDAAMTDGTAVLGTMFYGLRAMGAWPGDPGSNLLDGGAPFYDVYQCADERWIAVGPLEPRFFREFADLVGLDPELGRAQGDPARWDTIRDALTARFLTQTAAEWNAVFAGTDACATEVMDLWEAPDHPHNRSRDTFFTDDHGVVQPAPAPRFSRTPGKPAGSPPLSGEHSREILEEAGYTADDVTRMIADNVVAEN